MQGSKQEPMGIASEQRAEPQAVGRAGCARYSAYGVLPIRQNESGTAEVIMPLSLEQRDKGFSFYSPS